MPTRGARGGRSAAKRNAKLSTSRAKQVAHYACAVASSPPRFPSWDDNAVATRPKRGAQMPDTSTSSIAGIPASPSASPGLCCPSYALEPTTSPAEELSPRLPTITKHEVILGTAAAVAVTPSLKGEVAAFEGKDAPRVVGRHRLADQRHNRQHRQSPAMTLKLMPGLVVLERIPVPVLAIACDGSIFFANTAFSEMVGREPDEVL